jgi:hypothetical protein
MSLSAPADHRVAAALGRVGGRDPADAGRAAEELDHAVIAQDDVHAGTGLDPVASRAAEHDVGAAARRDRVRGARLRRGGLDDAEGDRLGAEARSVARGGPDAPGVAEDELAPVARGHRVGPRARDDDVVAETRGDDVVAAVGGSGRPDPVDVRGIGVVAGKGPAGALGGDPVDRAAVAQDEVVARARANGVGARAADDDVRAGARRDVVVGARERLERLDDAERDLEGRRRARWMPPRRRCGRCRRRRGCARRPRRPCRRPRRR